MFTMLPGFASPHNLTWDCCCNTILSAKTPGSFTLAKSVVEIKAKKEKGRFSESLSSSNVQDLYEYHRNCREEDELQIITQMKDGEIRDVLDWSVPKRERVIPITYSRQNPPKIDDLYKKMKKVFDENMPDLHG